MTSTSKIEWTDATWNPVRGCTRVSPGCQHCYAEGIAARFSAEGMPYQGLAKMVAGEPRWTNKVRMLPEKLGEPLHWRKPRRVFVNSMSDLFHEEVRPEFIAAVFGVMGAARQHTFQVLTKRPERMLEWFTWAASTDGFNLEPSWFACHKAAALNCHDYEPYTKGKGWDLWPPPNVWVGVSAEDQQRADERIPLLLRCPAAVRFISAEPLLGPIELTGYLSEEPTSYPGEPPGYRGIYWVIVGGESGQRARACSFDWIRSLVSQCQRSKVPVFVKQAGSWLSRNERHDSKGACMAHWPEDLRVRKFPDANLLRAEVAGDAGAFGNEARADRRAPMRREETASS